MNRIVREDAVCPSSRPGLGFALMLFHAWVRRDGVFASMARGRDD